MAAADAGQKRRGFTDEQGKDIFDRVKGKKAKTLDQKGLAKKADVDAMVKEYMTDYSRGVVTDDKPFIGAQPKLLTHPEIPSAAQTARSTEVAANTIRRLIASCKQGLDIMLAEDSRESTVTKELLQAATDEADEMKGAKTLVSLAPDWCHTLPFDGTPERPQTGKRLLIYVGTPGKYLSMCIRSNRNVFDEAYSKNNLVVLCRGVVMLPLGTQEQNVFGVEHDEVLLAIMRAVKEKGVIAWGHGESTKALIMQKAYGFPKSGQVPKPLTFCDGDAGNINSFSDMVQYVKYLNLLKIAKPSLPVTNWYDTGLLVSVLTGCIANHNASLLTDTDGLAILRDASIGHIISKLNQVMAVEPFKSSKGVYNFFIGDGACRLNGGVELALHLMEGYTNKSMTTLWIFNNHKWAIEDNLVAETEKEHVLYNRSFYDLIQEHGQVCMCDNEFELRETLAFLSRKTEAYVAGKADPGLWMVVVRGLTFDMPPMLGDLNPIRESPEMKFMRDVLGKFAGGCQHKVPIYGCSAFEYIQFLHIFMDEYPEGKKYQYVCGRTDIQAAHMCGFRQPEGKCVLFINDVYGINSLGESLRMVLSGFGGRQLLVMIWHPSLVTVIDHFQLHRPPMVWPSLGTNLSKYYVRKESDALFVDFEGNANLPSVTEQVNGALHDGKPLVVVNMLPEQERDFVSLDIRVKSTC